MSEADYQQAVIQCVLCARVLSSHDLPGILKAIDHADAIGCFVDPTLYIQNRDKMLEDREIIDAALPLWRLAQKLKPREGPG